ncbi:AhpC/TSA antioxidant enzyme-domain-containing protein [Aspergillus germanicus]
MSHAITRSAVDIPGPDELRDAYELELRCANGNPVRLGELICEKGDHITTIIVFVRHFFCAYDQDYVRTISHHLTDSMLQSLPSTSSTGPSQLIIIGCGDPALITPYVSETSTPFPIYSDPSGRIYENLHMTRTTSKIMEQPSYSTVGFWRSLGKAFCQMAASGWKGLRGGGWGQNGGEWVFKDGKCVYVHRMENVGDHLTAGELLEVLGCGDGDEEGEVGKAKEEMREEVERRLD